MSKLHSIICKENNQYKKLIFSIIFDIPKFEAMSPFVLKKNINSPYSITF